MGHHHDRNQLFRLFGARRVGVMVAADPSLLKRAKKELALMAQRPGTGAAVALWTRLLERPVAEIVEALGRDDVEGDFVRKTMPAFVALDADVVADLLAAARRAFDQERTTA